MLRAILRHTYDFFLTLCKVLSNLLSLLWGGPDPTWDYFNEGGFSKDVCAVGQALILPIVCLALLPYTLFILIQRTATYLPYRPHTLASASSLLCANFQTAGTEGILAVARKPATLCNNGRV